MQIDEMPIDKENNDNQKVELTVNGPKKEMKKWNNKGLTYTEFLAANILDIKDFFNDSELQSIFALFDTDNSGQITK